MRNTHDRKKTPRRLFFQKKGKKKRKKKKKKRKKRERAMKTKIFDGATSPHRRSTLRRKKLSVPTLFSLFSLFFFFFFFFFFAKKQTKKLFSSFFVLGLKPQTFAISILSQVLHLPQTNSKQKKGDREREKQNVVSLSCSEKALFLPTLQDVIHLSKAPL